MTFFQKTKDNPFQKTKDDPFQVVLKRIKKDIKMWWQPQLHKNIYTNIEGKVDSTNSRQIRLI